MNTHLFSKLDDKLFLSDFKELQRKQDIPIILLKFNFGEGTVLDIRDCFDGVPKILFQAE